MIEQGCELMEVSSCISGARQVNEGVLASVAILTDRLERLKNTSDLFAGVSFSEDVEALAACHMPTALC
jgi:hypothetical protein